jgi:hypothetical protein
MKPLEFRIVTFVVLILLGTCEAFLAHNVFYTAGEVGKEFYWIMVGLNIPLLVIALWNPRWALWGSLALGTLLLPWQTTANRKLVEIHEEVAQIRWFVEEAQRVSGEYPDTLSGYDFQHGWAKEHIAYSLEKGSLQKNNLEDDDYKLSYFISDPGITYWYPADGFAYYPD